MIILLKEDNPEEQNEEILPVGWEKHEGIYDTFVFCKMIHTSTRTYVTH